MTNNHQRDSKQILLSVLGNFPSGIVALGFRGEILLVNEHAAFILTGSKNAQTLLGKDMFSLLNQESELYQRLRLNVKEGREAIELSEIEYEGNYLSIGVKPFINGLILSIDDITEQVISARKAQRAKELELKNRELEQFSYIVSHDLQEPLNTIKGFIDVIDMRYGDDLPGDCKDYMTFMKESAVRMGAQIDGLLDFSRIGRDKPLETVDLQEIVDNLKVDLGQQIERTNASIRCTSVLPTVEGYAQELRSLVKNLLTNAMKYVPQGTSPQVTISWEKTEDGHSFSFADNGVGIAPENYEKVFQMFQRLENKGAYQGNGIGMAHSKKIVEMHNGDIWITSEVGAGTTFHFTLEL